MPEGLFNDFVVLLREGALWEEHRDKACASLLVARAMREVDQVMLRAEAAETRTTKLKVEHGKLTARLEEADSLLDSVIEVIEGNWTFPKGLMLAIHRWREGDSPPLPRKKSRQGMGECCCPLILSDQCCKRSEQCRKK